jgi:hypothetical protein
VQSFENIRILYNLLKFSSSFSLALTINSVMSVKQLLDQISSDDIQGQQQLTALLYCVLTHLDIDGLQQVLSTKW